MLLKSNVTIETGGVSLNLELLGQGGEAYHAGVFKDGEHQAPPSYAILDEKGNTLTSGTLGYGPGGGCMGLLQLPKGFKGKLRVEIKADFGPFEVMHEEKWHRAE